MFYIYMHRSKLGRFSSKMFVSAWQTYGCFLTLFISLNIKNISLQKASNTSKANKKAIFTQDKYGQENQNKLKMRIGKK